MANGKYETVEVRFHVTDGYYLYRHRFKFQADGVTFDEPVLPPGKPKKDDTFGEVEIYRGELIVPLAIATGKAPFELNVTSQGCADMGICYPPQTQPLSVTLPDPASAPSRMPILGMLAGMIPGMKKAKQAMAAAARWLD